MKLKLPEIREDSIRGANLRGQLLSVRPFLMKDTGIDSKIFHVWKAKGLVDFIERGKWARLSLVEYLWLRTLETMRLFGCSVSLMKKIYDDLFTKAFEENLFEKNQKDNLRYYRNLNKSRPLTKDESDKLYHLEMIEKTPALINILRYEVSYFYQLVVECLVYKVETGIIIFEDRTFTKFFRYPDDVPKNDNGEIIDLTQAHLYLPISSHILEFIADADKEDFLVPTGLMSEDEYRVIREIRNKNVKAITITFKESEHKIEKIECDKKGLIKGGDAKKIMNLLGLKNYSGIELNTRDGKTLSFTHTQKIFL